MNDIRDEIEVVLFVPVADDTFNDIDLEATEEIVGWFVSGRDQIVVDLVLKVVLVNDFNELVWEALVVVVSNFSLVGPFRTILNRKEEF